MTSRGGRRDAPAPARQPGRTTWLTIRRRRTPSGSSARHAVSTARRSVASPADLVVEPERHLPVADAVGRRVEGRAGRIGVPVGVRQQGGDEGREGTPVRVHRHGGGLRGADGGRLGHQPVAALGHAAPSTPYDGQHARVRQHPDVPVQRRRRDVGQLGAQVDPRVPAPRPADLARLNVPVLAITGEEDLQVPADDLAVLAAIVPGPVELHRVPVLTNTLRRQERALSVRRSREELRRPVDPEVLATVITWCRSVTGVPASSRPPGQVLPRGA